MKKLLLLLLAFVATLNVSAKSYRGFVDFMYGRSPYNLRVTDRWGNDKEFPTSWGLYTTHGAQLNNCFFVGGGIGWYESRLSESLGEGFLSSGAMMFAPYASTRWDLNICKVFTPYASVDLGCQFGDFTGVYFKSTVGVRFRCHSLIGINVGLSYNPVMPEEYFVDGDWAGCKYGRMLMLNLGVDF